MNPLQSFLAGKAGVAGPAPAVSGNELARLIAPTAPADFARDRFGRRSLMNRGEPDRFDHIFGWSRLDAALERGRGIADERFNVTASYAGGEADGSDKAMFRAELGQVKELLRNGATICITNIHMADPALAEWAQAVRAQLGFTGTVGINCYASPDGAGLPMHFDKRVATTLQISGSKRWTYSTEAAVAWPRENGVWRNGRIEPAQPDPVRPPDDMTFEDVELQPGDLLCLPAGAWHAARGIGHSLALNLYFAPRNLFDQIGPLVGEFVGSDPAWRGGPPALGGTIDGTIPPEVATYYAARLRDLAAECDRLAQDDGATGARWLNALSQAPFTGWSPRPPRDLPPATAADRFAIARPPLPFLRTADAVLIPCDRGVMRFAPAFAALVERLNTADAALSVPDILALQPGEPHEAIAFLKALFQNGLLDKR